MLDFIPMDKTGARKKDPSSVKRQDVELYNDWIGSGKKPDKLRPLLKNFRGLIRSRANHWANQTDLPSAAVYSEFNDKFVQALDTYDPSRGTQISTWVSEYLKKGPREIIKYQNPTRISEHRFYKLGVYDNALANLEYQLDRDPTTQEISEYLKWPEAEVGRMQAEKRQSTYSSTFESGFDPGSFTPTREAEVLRLIKYELTPDELLVYEYRLGAGGKPKLKPGQIAKKLKMSQSKVSRIITAIGKKMEKYQ